MDIYVVVFDPCVECSLSYALEWKMIFSFLFLSCSLNLGLHVQLRSKFTCFFHSTCRHDILGVTTSKSTTRTVVTFLGSCNDIDIVICLPICSFCLLKLLRHNHWQGENLDLHPLVLYLVLVCWSLQYGVEIQFTQLWTTFKIQMKWLIIGDQIFMNQHQICWPIWRRLIF